MPAILKIVNNGRARCGHRLARSIITGKNSTPRWLCGPDWRRCRQRRTQLKDAPKRRKGRDLTSGPAHRVAGSGPTGPLSTDLPDRQVEETKPRARSHVGVQRSHGSLGSPSAHVRARGMRLQLRVALRELSPFLTIISPVRPCSAVVVVHVVVGERPRAGNPPERPRKRSIKFETMTRQFFFSPPGT